MKNRHYLIYGSLLLGDLQALGHGLHNGLSLSAEDCLSIGLRHGLPYVCLLDLTLHNWLCLPLRHSLNRALLRRRLPDIPGLRLTLHLLGLSLRHCLGRTLICGSGYIRGPRHALGHRLVSGKACLLLPLLSLALKGSLMLYSLNDCRIS